MRISNAKLLVAAMAVAFAAGAPALAAAQWRLIGWNNLGMHCMDPDYAVFATSRPARAVTPAPRS